MIIQDRAAVDHHTGSAAAGMAGGNPRAHAASRDAVAHGRGDRATRGVARDNDAMEHGIFHPDPVEHNPGICASGWLNVDADVGGVRNH
jgi:hypothetical protein